MRLRPWTGLSAPSSQRDDPRAGSRRSDTPVRVFTDVLGFGEKIGIFASGDAIAALTSLGQQVAAAFFERV